MLSRVKALSNEPLVPLGGPILYTMDSLTARIRALTYEKLQPIFFKYVKGQSNNVPEDDRVLR